MTDLVIVGRYPFPERRREGMVQRIASIDAQLAELPRAYLDLYALKHLQTDQTSFPFVTVYTLSFLRVWKIYTVLRAAKHVYVHSIYFYALLLLPLVLAGRRSQLILDLHGAVPEELRHQKRFLLAAAMATVEWIAFRRTDVAICVTRQMESFYREKYPSATTRYLYLPIFTSEVCQPADRTSVQALRDELGISAEMTVFIYSGGLQAWQNVERMLDAIECLHPDTQNFFILLTAEVDALNMRISQRFGTKTQRIVVTHATPESLRNYYHLSSYGFILREDHTLNRVANPTKLVEYLFFGIRPIVWSADIGDFPALGYEFLRLEELERSPVPVPKSEVNRQISLKLLRDAESASLLSFLRS